MAIDSLEDDRGCEFSGGRLAPLTPELLKAVTKRSYIDAHLMLTVGLFTAAMYLIGRQSIHWQPFHRRTWWDFGFACLIGSVLRYGYVFFAVRPKQDRHRLLKRAVCPVCLRPLDKKHAHGETITCECGATWERRYM